MLYDPIPYLLLTIILGCRSTKPPVNPHFTRVGKIPALELECRSTLYS